MSDLDVNQEEVVLQTNLQANLPKKKREVVYRFQFSKFDVFLLCLNVAGIVMCSTCFDASKRNLCGGYNEIGIAGLALVLGTLVPYLIIIIMHFVTK